MNEHDESLTFRELVIVVARMFGLADDADGVWTVPSDPGNLNFCKDIVRRALRMVVNDHPRWRWLRQRLTIELAASTSEYTMPWWFDGQTVENRFIYSTGGPSLVVRVVREEEIRGIENTTGGLTGDPVRIAFFLPNTDAPAGHPKQRRWKALVNPTPTQARTLSGLCRAIPSLPWDLDDHHPAGPAMNGLIESACRAVAEMESDKKSSDLRKQYDADLARAVERDAESGPRILGPSTDPEDEDDAPRTFGPLSINGTTLA